MNYEIVTLEAKTMVGYTAHMTSNDPKMGEVIGGLWKQLFEGGTFATLKHKVNEHSIGLYADYADDMHAEYSITVGCEVSSAKDQPSGTTVRLIPAGRYAKFIIFGDMVQAVGNAWQQIWNIPLERTYTGDFEEYVSTQESGDAEIHIYVAVK